jgi:putative hydrolase of the HAD superfamily
MVRGILFDMGGTLDGDGRHWLTRFVDLYAAAGIDRSFETLRGAFDAAEGRAADDDAMRDAGLHAMVSRHVAWQFEALEIADRSQCERIVRGFEEPVREAARRNVQALAALRARGLDLGVVSNGCGNVAALCSELGYAPFLSAIVDSRRVGVAKPAPAIYVLAAQRLGHPPPAILMVGDSFERDIRPAKGVGMKTAWLHANRPCPDAAMADLLLDSVDTLPAALDARTRTVA